MSAWNSYIFLLFYRFFSEQIIMLFSLCPYRRGTLIVESRFERNKRVREKEKANSHTDFLRVWKSPNDKVNVKLRQVNVFSKYLSTRRDIICEIFLCTFFSLSRLNTVIYVIALSIPDDDKWRLRVNRVEILVVRNFSIFFSLNIFF